MRKSTQILFAAVAVACYSCMLPALWAQTFKKKTEPIKGTVVSIEKAKIGKSYTLTMKAEDDTEYEVPIVLRTSIKIIAKGDAGFVKPGAMIYFKVYEFEGPADFTAQDLTISLGVPAQPHITTISQKEDEPDTEICGKIEGIKKKAIENEVDMYRVNCGTRTITLECATEEVEITLHLADPAFIKAGDTVEADGPVIASRKQIKANTITVTSAEPIQAADYFAAIEDSKKSKSSRATTKSKSKTETESEDQPDSPTKDAGTKEADPFGVLKGKKSKSKTENTDKSGTDSESKDASKGGKQDE